MTCPHLEYRSEAGEQSFDHERPYCAVMEAFCSPMRADVCNDRFDFDHAAHCEVFQNHAESEYDEGETTRPKEIGSVTVQSDGDG